MWDQQKNIYHRAGGGKTLWVCVYITFWTVHAFITQRSYSYWGHFCLCVCLSCVLFECGWAVRSPLSAQFRNRRHIPAAALCTRRICCSHENPKDVQICKLAVCHMWDMRHFWKYIYFCLHVWYWSTDAFQETLERQLSDPQVLTPDLSKPEVRASIFFYQLHQQTRDTNLTAKATHFAHATHLNTSF